MSSGVTPGMNSGSAVEYLAGGWVGIVGPGTWLLIESDPAVPFVQQCWRLVRDGAGATRILDAIHGQTADEVRDFALVCVDEESTHAAVRGNSSIRLQAAENGPVTLVLGVVSGSAGPAHTVDRLYDWPAVTFQVAVGYETALPPREGQALLPLTAGAVLASAIGGRPRPNAGASVSASAVASADVDVRAEDEDRMAISAPPAPAPSVPHEFDFDFTPSGSDSERANADSFGATPVFSDEETRPDSAAGEEDAGRSGAFAIDTDATGEHEFGFASASTAVRPAQDEDLFASPSLYSSAGADLGSTFGGEQAAGKQVADDEIMAELTGSFRTVAAQDESARYESAQNDLARNDLARNDVARNEPGEDHPGADDSESPATVLLPVASAAQRAAASSNPLPDNEIEAEDPDFAPTMLVPSRPAMPPAPEPVAGAEQDGEQEDPDFAPTMLVPSRPVAGPPIPMPDDARQASTENDDPDFAPTMLVPARPSAVPPVPAPGNGTEAEDPDFAPTMLVPANPHAGPPVPAPAPAPPPAPAPAPEQDDPDFAPTMLVPSAPAGDFAPPAGPRVAVGAPVAQEQPIQPPRPDANAGAGAGANPSADTAEGQESDAGMIWKLDWWGSSRSGSESAAQAAPQSPDYGQAPSAQLPPQQPASQPGPAQPVPQPPHLSAPPAPQPLPYQAAPSPDEDEASMTVPRPGGQSSPEADPAGRPLVPAVRCPAGHLNPPQAARCRVCATPVPAQASYQIPQPVLGILRLSTGGDVPLDRDVFLGRDPSNTEERKARKPHMLRLPSPGKDISRDHLEIRLVGWRVMVIDLGSTNGTTVIVPGGRPEPLAAGGSRMIEPGTQVVLAEEVSLVYEVTS